MESVDFSNMRQAMVDGHVFWRYSVLLKRGDPRRVYARLAEQGVEAMPPFAPMYRIPQFSGGQDPRRFPVTEDVYRRLLSLPGSPHLERDQVEEIVRIFHEAVSAEA